MDRTQENRLGTEVGMILSPQAGGVLTDQDIIGVNGSHHAASNTSNA